MDCKQSPKLMRTSKPETIQSDLDTSLIPTEAFHIDPKIPTDRMIWGKGNFKLFIFINSAGTARSCFMQAQLSNEKRLPMLAFAFLIYMLIHWRTLNSKESVM